MRGDFFVRPWLSVLFITAVFLSANRAPAADDQPRGTSVVIGGNLRPDNKAVYGRLIEAAGGIEKARFVVFPTAGTRIRTALRMGENLVSHGLPAAQVSVIDIRVENAETTTADAAIVEQIRQATACYFTGGDQGRIARAFYKPDGTDTPALAAVREVWRRGGVVGGTSAGAAMQSDTMIAVSGLPDSVLDDGMDALDFGLTRQPTSRGLLVSRGLGFFPAGIVDQHFSQFRGRLGRLARAATEQKARYGFGVDENTAMVVAPTGKIEVIGTGYVTIVDASAATIEDGPTGCKLAGLGVSCLQAGDVFDPATGELTIPAAKRLTTTQPNRGNHLITDIAGERALMRALFSGLAANTAREQIGLSLRYNQSFGHGYRFTFKKTDATRSWAGYIDNVYSHSIAGVQMAIDPILSTLRPPETAAPTDLPAGAAATACLALWFRGIMLTDDERHFRPDEPITRADLAVALANAVHLLPPIVEPASLSDVPPDAPWRGDALKALETKLVKLDDRGLFRPADPVLRQEAAEPLVNLYVSQHPQPMTAGEGPQLADLADAPELLRPTVLNAVTCGLLAAGEGRVRPTAPLTRREAAEAVYRILGFPW